MDGSTAIARDGLQNEQFTSSPHHDPSMPTAPALPSLHVPPEILIDPLAARRPLSPPPASLVASPVSRPSSPSPIPSPLSPHAGYGGAAAPPSPASASSPPSPGVGKAPAGTQPDEVYRRLMSPTRFAIRRWLLRALDREMPVLPRIQEACRTPALDRVMVSSSWMGSHTFFMAFLPMCYWFDRPAWSHGLIYILAAGVFITGCIKDYVCVPRPYSPPLVRLSIGTHSAEYGFPSTHSTTTFGSALFAVQLIFEAQAEGDLRVSLLAALTALLSLYIIVLVFGRLYCGMHSMQDVGFGSVIGGLVWAAHAALSSALRRWATSGSWWVPLLTLLLGLFLVSAHPQPVDDCPCFEDSVAFVAVAMGITIAQWVEARFDVPTHPGLAHFRQSLPALGQLLLTVFGGLIKLVVGLVCIFVWRMAAKEVLRRALPPVFRTVAPLLQLPRRHYVPATDYDRYKKDEDANPMIPSVLDLSSLPRQSHALHPQLRNRNPGALGADPLQARAEKQKPGMDGSVEGQHPAAERPQHYDVDVLMRVIVYAGIGFISAFSLPALFRYTGLNALAG